MARRAAKKPRPKAKARARSGFCPVHRRQPVVGLCRACDAFVCARDVVEVQDTIFCRKCAGSRAWAALADDRRPRRRGRSSGGGPARWRQPWDWRPFRAARDFARSLGLSSRREWTEYMRGRLPGREPPPRDVPAAPRGVYGRLGQWRGWRDWLGYTRRAPRAWRSFADARAFVRALGLRSQREWRTYTRGQRPGKPPLPSDVPRTPDRAYRDHWRGLGDWLGTGRVASRERTYRSFAAARRFARTLGLRSGREWLAYVRGQLPGRPPPPGDVPRKPWYSYRDEWRGLGDWLGTGRLATQERKYRSFAAARRFARSLGLRGQVDWQAFCRGDRPEKGVLPPDVPAGPGWVYARDWKGFGDWLGTGRLSPAERARRRRPFEAARTFARSLGLRTVREWREHVRERRQRGDWPVDVPVTPERPYREEWRGWGDWLGARTLVRSKRPFRAARAFARSLGLANGAEWREYTRGLVSGKPPLPPDIPVNPRNAYEEWSSTEDWLGAPSRWRRKGGPPRPFVEARAFARKLGLRTGEEWLAFCRGKLRGKGTLPPDVPAYPHSWYDEWGGFADWLGPSYVGRSRPTYRPFAEARAFARALGLRTQAEWRRYATGRMPEAGARPPDVPASPQYVYRHAGWSGLADWLGVEPFQVPFRPFGPRAPGPGTSASSRSGSGWPSCTESARTWA